MHYMLGIAKKSLRFGLRTIYRENRIYPIPFGPCRGMKMRYFPNIQFHVILGLYDSKTMQKIAEVLRATGRVGGNAVYCDLGANVGAYSLWFSRMVPKGKVYSFEPMPEIFKQLRDHIEINEIGNIEAVPKACSNQEGNISFFLGVGGHEFSSLLPDLAKNGKDIAAVKVEVPTTTLDAFFETKEGPDFIKMDIEGGGIYALKGCDRVVENKRPVWMVESHRPEEDRAVSDLVQKHNYCAYRLNDSEWVKEPGEVQPNPNGIWGSLLLIPSEEMDLVKHVLPSTKSPQDPQS